MPTGVSILGANANFNQVSQCGGDTNWLVPTHYPMTAAASKIE